MMSNNVPDLTADSAFSSASRLTRLSRRQVSTSVLPHRATHQADYRVEHVTHIYALRPRSFKWC